MKVAREKLERERCDSAGDSIEEYSKREREMLGRDLQERERELADIFKRSRKVARSPGEKEGGGFKGAVEGVKRENKRRIERGKTGDKGGSGDAKEGEEDRNREDERRFEEKGGEMGKRKEEDEGKDRKDGTGVRRVKNRYKRRKEWGRRRRSKGEEDEGGKEEEEEGNWRERIRKLERGYERRKREERKKNIIMKGIKEEKGGMRIEVESAEEIGGRSRCGGNKKVRRGRREKESMAVEVKE